MQVILFPSVFLLIIIVFVLFLFRKYIADYINNPDEYRDKGSTGERLLYMNLRTRFPEKNILRNVYLHRENGKLTEIDIVLITNSGIIVLESKNYTGWIFGNEYDSNWTQTFPKGTKVKFFNPVSQNTIHISSLQHNLSEFPNLLYFSIVVFGNECELKEVPASTENTYVINKFNLFQTIDRISARFPNVISDFEIEKIIETLTPYSRPNEEIRKQHLLDIQKFN